MAAKTIAIDDGSTVERWSKEVGVEAVWKNVFLNPAYGFCGKGHDNLICKKEEFSDKIGGNQLTCTLVMQMTDDGLVDGAPAEGNEIGYDHYEHIFEVHELGNKPFAVRSQLDQPHVEWDVAATGKNLVSDWWSRMLSAGIAMQLGGATFTTALDYYKPGGLLVRAGNAGSLGHQFTGMNASSAPTTGREFWSGAQSASEDLTSSHPITLDDIDELIDTAPQTKPPIRPCKWAGGEHYICFLHQDQWSDLATDTRYKEIQVAQLQGGQGLENNVFGTGNLAPYRNTIFVTSVWNPPSQHSSTEVAQADTRKAMLCGAQALSIGWGKGNAQNRFRWHIESFNVGGSKRMMARSLWGAEKAVYNSKDYGVLVLNTYAKNRGDA